MGIIIALLTFWLNISVPILEPIVTASQIVTPSFDNLKQVNAEPALRYATGMSVTIALIDTGLDINHPHYANTEVDGYNIISNTTEFNDQCGHGTSVAGPIVSIAPDAKLLVVKVFNENCRTIFYYMNKAVVYAVDNGAKVINMSITGLCYGNNSDIQAAIDYAYDHNVTIVAAMGNENDSQPRCPAMNNHVMSVGGVDDNDYPYYRSNYGEWIDVVAPAVSVWVPYTGYKESEYKYIPLSGTSLAAPHVTGLIALLYDIKPDITVDEVIEIVNSTATDLDKFIPSDIMTNGFDLKTGYGRIEVYAAVIELIERYDLYAELGFQFTYLPIAKVHFLDTLP